MYVSLGTTFELLIIILTANTVRPELTTIYLQRPPFWGPKLGIYNFIYLWTTTTCQHRSQICKPRVVVVHRFDSIGILLLISFPQFWMMNQIVFVMAKLIFLKKNGMERRWGVFKWISTSIFNPVLHYLDLRLHFFTNLS